MVGDSFVGKSSIVLRYTEGSFSEDQGATIGVDFKQKTVNIDDAKITLLLWDTAGSEKHRTLNSFYYRGAQALIFVFDCSRRKTFENLEYWLNECQEKCTVENAVKMLICNKIDNKEERQVTFDEASDFGKKHSLLVMETSAKTNEGIDKAFEEVIRKILDCPSLARQSAKPPIITLGEKEESSRCCGLL